MKSKGRILTCGYFCLNSTLKELHNMGWELIKLHQAENKDAPYLIDDSDTLQRGLLEQQKLENLIVSSSTRSRREIKVRKLREAEQFILSMYGVGGKGFTQEPAMLNILASKVLGQISNMNGIHDYMYEKYEKDPYDAIITHTGEGQTWRSVIEVAKHMGIPTFVCLNGTICRTVPMYSAHQLYNSADVYYLHGEYDKDWAADRNIEFPKENFPIVGQPSFDWYYTNKGKLRVDKAEPNVFTYCTTVVCSIFYVDKYGLDITVDMIDFAAMRDDLPTNTDGMFLEGFAKYQKYINPDAKLKISLRPYYNLDAKGYTNFVEKFGVKNFEVYEHTNKKGRELIREGEYVISGESTMLVEAMINRKPMLYLYGRNKESGGFAYHEEWSAGSATDDSDSIVDAIIDMTERKEELKEACNKYASYYNYNDDGRAGKRMAKDIDRRLS